MSIFAYYRVYSLKQPLIINGKSAKKSKGKIKA